MIFGFKIDNYLIGGGVGWGLGRILGCISRFGQKLRGFCWGLGQTLCLARVWVMIT